jgi:phosphate:Na+ symporter
MPGYLILLNLLAAIALLVWGITMVKTGILGSFGAELRRALVAATKGPIRSAATGIGVAGLLQSSTATALLLTGFVSRAVVTLPAALAVMLGADLGTSLVVQALAFDLTALLPLLIVAGVAIALVSANGRMRDVGRIVLGFGLVLLALTMIGAASAPLRESPLTGLLFGRLAGDPVLAILLAAVMTWALHSSVAFLIFVISLVNVGVVPVGLGLFLVLGGNLGAGLVPLSLAFGAPVAARRVYYGNLIFRAVGVLLAAPLVAQVAPLLADLGADAGRQVAHFHTGFNLVLLLVFLPFCGLLARALTAIWPEPAANQAQAEVNHLAADLLDRPHLALNAAMREVMRMADKVELMLQLSIQVFDPKDEGTSERIRGLEAEVDAVHDDIKLYLSRLLQHRLDTRQSEQVMEMIMFTINLENVGDIIDRGLLAMADKKRRLDLRFTDAGWSDILAFHERTSHQMRLAMTVFVRRDPNMARELVNEKDGIRALEAATTERHLNRLLEGDPDSIQTSALHLDVIRDLKRIAAHLTSVAYPILEERGVLRGTRLRPEKGSPKPDASLPLPRLDKA